MKYSSLFLVTLTFGVMAHAQSDEPDLSYESRLHDIYVNFNSKPMAPGEWQSIVGERQSEVYGIQKGDTLWGISQTLFSDGNYWPKIWSINGTIENPHLITEGNSIRFLLGNESEAPSFAVSENAQLEEEAVAAAPVGSHEVEIPPPSVPPKPLLRKLPPSLPQWQDEELGKNYDSAGFEFVRRPILDIKSSVKIPAYFAEEEPQGVGTVKETEATGGSAGQFQYVYVELPSGQYKKGDRFLVVRNMGTLDQSHDSISSSSLGYQVQIQGEVSLDERTSKQDSDEQKDVFRALITRNINPVEVGGVLVKDRWLYADFNDQGPKNLVVAQIVGGSNDRKSQLFGYGSTTFLNRGSKDGLAVGQILPVRANRQVRKPNSNIWDNRPIGYLKIVKVTPHLSTAIVLKSFEDIMAGDLTGQGPLLPSEGVVISEKETVLEEMQEDQMEEDSEDAVVEDMEESASSDDMEEEESTEESSDEESDLDSELE